MLKLPAHLKPLLHHHIVHLLLGQALTGLLKLTLYPDIARRHGIQKIHVLVRLCGHHAGQRVVHEGRICVVDGTTDEVGDAGVRQ